MRRAPAVWVVSLVMLASCEQPTSPQYPRAEPYYVAPAGGGGGGGGYASPDDPNAALGQGFDPGEFGKLDSALVDFEFDGGKLEFELRREGTRILQIARNRYAVPVVIAWTVGMLDNVAPTSRTMGVALLPAAATANGRGAAVVLAELTMIDPSLAYRRNLSFTARFGDPAAKPETYAYQLPFKKGLAFSVLQGFHGAFSHRGSNEFAIDFDCPVATPVVAARDGLVVATNARAQGAGTTRDYLEYKRVNFVLVLHADGSLGEYMHLSPSGINVKPGQKIARGTQLGLSGHTGFSSTPHLHFQVMTAAEDGVNARSFPFQFALGKEHVVVPVQGHTYLGWE